MLTWEEMVEFEYMYIDLWNFIMQSTSLTINAMLLKVRQSIYSAIMPSVYHIHKSILTYIHTYIVIKKCHDLDGFDRKCQYSCDNSKQVAMVPQ